MLILLPPSETKRVGGPGEPLRHSQRLSFSEQDVVRKKILDTVMNLARDPRAMIRALKLGPTQAGEVEVNRLVWESATMPAIERFTGVLYDALDLGSLDVHEREVLSQHVVIQSALFGLIRADDLIPAYRLSFDSRLPGCAPLSTEWSEAGTRVLERQDGLIVDLRSEGYAALAPLPIGDNAVYVRALGRTPSGAVRQLNHFNKKGKGVFLRAIARAGVGEEFPDVSSLLSWASKSGIELTQSEEDRVLNLIINEADYPPLRVTKKT